MEDSEQTALDRTLAYADRKGIDLHQAVATAVRKQTKDQLRSARRQATDVLESQYGDVDEDAVAADVIKAAKAFAHAVETSWYGPDMTFETDEVEERIRFTHALKPFLVEVQAGLHRGDRVRVEHPHGVAVYSVGMVEDLETGQRARVVKVGKCALNPPDDFDVAVASEMQIIEFVIDGDAIRAFIEAKTAPPVDAGGHGLG